MKGEQDTGLKKEMETVQILVLSGHTSRRKDVMAIKNEIVYDLLKGADPKKVF
jgi:hypothetical protein